jgi:hypothetical protein
MKKLAKKVGMELAGDICPGCVYVENEDYEGLSCGEGSPCPMYKIENFYFDNDMKRFWCKNWLGRCKNGSYITRPTTY